MSESSLDWCSFFALFWNDKGLKCKINIPDTVLFRYGQLSAWWATNKEGHVQRHATQNTTMEAIRRRFLQVSTEDDANYSKFVACVRTGNGRPQLLRLQAFNQLCEVLSDRLETGAIETAPDIETPTVLQAFVQPYMDLRYVTTYLNHGNNITCHTFQRKFSRRYTPLMSSTLAGAGALADKDADYLFSAEEAEARTSEMEESQGAVDPPVKMMFRKLTHHLVKYIEKAHKLTLGGLVVEYIRDASGRPYLLSILRAEWITNPSGRGGGGFGTTNLLAVPQEEPHMDSLIAEAESNRQQLEAERPYGEQTGNSPLPPLEEMAIEETVGDEDWDAVPELPTTQHRGDEQSFRPSSSHASSIRPMSARPPMAQTRPASSVRATSAMSNPGSPKSVGTRAALTAYPGGTRSTSENMVLTNSWPSFQHETSMSIGPAGAGLVDGASSRSASPTHQSPRNPHRAHSALVFSGPSGRQSRNAVRPTSSPPGAYHSYTPKAHGRSANVTRLSMSGPGAMPGDRGGVPLIEADRAARVGHAVMGVRGAPLLLQQLQHEVESLKEQVLVQHELAEASAAKVRQLEHERQITVTTFDTRVASLEAALLEVRGQLRSAREEASSERARADVAESKLAEVTYERSSINMLLDSERGTVLAAMKEFQERDATSRARVEQMEAEVLRLTEQLKEERTAINVLKRQMVEFSDIAERYKGVMHDMSLEPGMSEVMSMLAPLIDEQKSPGGESYAVQKTLRTFHSDLRSVFLHYAQLESSFTNHWPPSITYAQWMVFCIEAEVSDPRAGARIRSNANALMIPPNEAEAVYKMYAQRDFDSVSTSTEPVLTYEAFLAAVCQLAYRMRRPDNPYLSESIRDFMLRYMSKAKRVVPSGVKRSQLRQALEGASRQKEELKRGPRTLSGTVRSKKASGLDAGATGRTSSPVPGLARPQSANMHHLDSNSGIARELSALNAAVATAPVLPVRRGGGYMLPI